MTTTDGTHPRHRLDDLLQNPVRFSVVAALDHAGTLGFREVRDAVEVTDSALSKQVSALEARVRREGLRGEDAAHVTDAHASGRAAWRAHLAALRQIAGPPDADR